jgi:ATP-binding cassette subfamily C protein CydD
VSAITDKTRQQRSRQWLRRQQQAVRPLLRGAVAAGVLGGVAIAAQMGLMAWLVHALLIDAAPAHSLWPVMAALLVAILLRVLAAAVQERLGQLASAKVRQQVRVELSALWARLGPVRLAALPSASLTNQWVEQVDALDGYYARYLPQQWLALLVPLMLVALVVWLDWLAALFLLLAAPLIPLFMALVGMHAERISQRHVLQAGRMAGQFLDRVRNLTSLQLFGQVGRSIARIEQATQAYRTVTMATLKVAFLSSAVLEFFASVAIAVVAMYIGFGLLGYIDYGPSPELRLFSGLFILLLAPEFFQPCAALSRPGGSAGGRGCAGRTGGAGQPACCTARPAESRGRRWHSTVRCAPELRRARRDSARGEPAHSRGRGAGADRAIRLGQVQPAAWTGWLYPT